METKNRQIELDIAKYIPTVLGSILALISAGAFVFSVRINTISWDTNTFTYKSAFILGVLFAIYFILWFSKNLTKIEVLNPLTKHFCFLGHNSIDIVIWHFLAFRFAIIIQILVLKTATPGALKSFPVYDGSGMWWVLYLIAGVYGSLLFKLILAHNPLSGILKKFYIIR